MTSKEFFQLVERLYAESFEQLQRDLQRALNQKQLTKIFTPNPEQIMQAHRDSRFFAELLQGDLLLPDGTQLVKAAQAAKKAGKVESAPQVRLTGIDLLEWWLEQGSTENIPTVLLGGRAGVAEALAKKVDPQQSWCFGFSGYDSVANATQEEESTMRALIEERRPKVIFVAFGAPWQERWVLANEDWLTEQGVRVAAVCGGAFDVLSPAHRLQRAPRWMQQSGLEWLYRLFQEPGRWRRQRQVLEFLRLSKAWISEE